jgi:hypothetical protein
VPRSDGGLFADHCGPRFAPPPPSS